LHCFLLCNIIWNIFVVEIDENHTCDWTPTVSVNSNKGSVIGSFSQAPVEFGFSTYNIFLIADFSVVQQLTVNATEEVSFSV